MSEKIRYSDFETHTTQKRIPHMSADHVLIHLIKEHFQKLYQRRILILLLGIRFSTLVCRHYQTNISEDTEEGIVLYQAMDRIKSKYGSKTACRAIAASIACS